MKNENSEQTAKFYDIMTDSFIDVWSHHIHMALWTKNTKNLNEALDYTHKTLLNDANIKKTDKILDVGCGTGEFCVFLANDVDNIITGINISEYQLDIAEKKKKNLELNNVKFVKKNVYDLDSLGEKFDVVFMLEVGLHLHDTKKALTKIFKSLNDGGRVIIIDWLQKNKITRFEKELLINPLLKKWRFHSFESLETYYKIFNELNFKIIRFEDCSEQIYKSWEYAHDLIIRRIQEMDTIKFLNLIKTGSFKHGPKKTIEILKDSIEATFFTKICADIGVLKYGYFVVQKPI